MKRLLLCLLLAGCATPPKDPPVYRPTQPIHYPTPYE